MSAAADRQARPIPWLIASLLLVAVAVAYCNTLHAPFIFDDYNSILSNDHIKTLWPLTESMATVQDNVISGRPLVCLSLAVNYAVGEFDPFGYHLFNIATHIACALLMFGLIRRTLLLPRWNEKHRDTAIWFAAAAALLWAVHPLLTESVTYITQRTETMFSMFLLLTLYSMVRAVQAPARSHWLVFWRFIAVLACAAGMACKEVMVVAPILALLYQFIFLPPDPDRAGVRSLHLSLLCTLVIVKLELIGVNIVAKSGYGLQYLHSFDYFKTQPAIIVHYLRLSFWPRGLVLDYFDWPIVHNIAPALLPGLFLLILFIAAIYACCRRRWPGFLGAWFFLILAPTSSFLPIYSEVAAERRMYLPLASLVILFLAAIWSLIRNRAALSASVILIALLLLTLTIARNHQYHSAISIWSDAESKRPANPRAHFYLGLAYGEAEDWPRARYEDNLILTKWPDYGPAKVLLQFIQQHDPSFTQP